MVQPHDIISEFFSSLQPLFSDIPHTLSRQDLSLIAKILFREGRMPDELDVEQRMEML